MASSRAFIIPVRNDLSGLRINIWDLQPNTSQRNGSLDGDGQSGYLKYTMDRPATTTVSGNDYVSGSKTTSPLAATALADTDNDTNDDASVTTATEFGLLAYLRDRVHVNPGGNSDFLTPTEALNISNDIIDVVQAGTDLTLTVVNGLINDRVAGADSDLTGDAAGSSSFGTLEDIFRILSGEVYRVKANTILGTETGAWVSQADRQTLVDNQDGDEYFVSGDFLAEGDAGYQAVRTLALTGAVRGSVAGGVLSRLVGETGLAFTNPANAYAAGDVRAWKPRAVQFDGTAIPADGDVPVLRVYDGDGNILS